MHEGYRIEMVHPKRKTRICAATVSTVIDNYYYVATLDSEVKEESTAMMPSLVCHGNTLEVLPVGWCSKNGVELVPPGGRCRNILLLENGTAYTNKI